MPSSPCPPNPPGALTSSLYFRHASLQPTLHAFPGVGSRPLHTHLQSGSLPAPKVPLPALARRLRPQARAHTRSLSRFSTSLRSPPGFAGPQLRGPGGQVAKCVPAPSRSCPRPRARGQEDAATPPPPRSPLCLAPKTPPVPTTPRLGFGTHRRYCALCRLILRRRVSPRSLRGSLRLLGAAPQPRGCWRPPPSSSPPTPPHSARGGGGVSEARGEGVGKAALAAAPACGTQGRSGSGGGRGGRREGGGGRGGRTRGRKSDSLSRDFSSAGPSG